MGDILKLLSFIGFLKSEAGFMFDVDRFEHRLMLQKYVYIAGRVFRLPLSYSYNMYLRGPYSASLAEDYYKLSEPIGITSVEAYKKELTGFDSKTFLDLIKSKDAEWLEIAATILSLYRRYLWRYDVAKLEDLIMSTTCDIKSFLPKERIFSVFEDLRREGLIDI